MKLPILAEIVAAFQAKDPARIAGLYARDAVFVTPGRPPIVGREAVARIMAEDLRDPGFHLDLAEEKIFVSASGDMAYARGAFRASFTNPRTREVESVAGTYLQVFRRQPDGAWEIAEDISSPGAPAAG